MLESLDQGRLEPPIESPPGFDLILAVVELEDLIRQGHGVVDLSTAPFARGTAEIARARRHDPAEWSTQAVKRYQDLMLWFATNAKP